MVFCDVDWVNHVLSEECVPYGGMSLVVAFGYSGPKVFGFENVLGGIFKSLAQAKAEL